jgi:hypothetical protein
MLENVYLIRREYIGFEVLRAVTIVFWVVTQCQRKPDILEENIACIFKVEE